MSAEDRFALQDVLSRYAAGLDDLDYDLYRACFAEDVVVHGMGPEPIEGIDAWVSFVKKAMSRYKATQHMLGPQLATIDGDTASTRTDLQARHYFVEPDDSGKTTFTLWATYFTEMIKVDGAWKIKRHELVRRGHSTA